MTQARLDLQTHLDQNTTNITTSPLFIDSPVLFLESTDQSTTTTHNTATNTYEQTEQVEHHSLFQKHPTLLEIFTVDNAHERPPPPKKIRNYERSFISFFTRIRDYITYKMFILYNSR